MSTEGGEVLEPHQVAVDKQELWCLHHLTGALLGGTAPAANGVTAESVPYTLPTVGCQEVKCPVCHQVFKTNHHLRRHMDIHKGSGYSCNKCHKSLSSRKMLGQHEAACKQGCKHACGTCGREYSSVQILKQHGKVSHGAGCPLPDEVFVCPYSQKTYNVKKSWGNILPHVHKNPTRKGSYFCQVEECPRVQHPFQCIKNLSSHMASTHGCKECCE